MKTILLLAIISVIAVVAFGQQTVTPINNSTSPSPSVPLAKKVRVHGCYYSNWSQHRKDSGKFLPENIDASLCSHIFYAFVGMNHLFQLEPYEKNDLDQKTGKDAVVGLYTRVNDLKKKHPELKTLLAFGGYVFTIDKSDLMIKMLAKKENRRRFIADVVKVLRKHKFDGFDVNWYPVDQKTKADFVLLVKELRETFDKEKVISKLPRLLLSVAIPPQIDRIKKGYDGKSLSSWVDKFHLMAFDYHGPWENQTGINAPLESEDGRSVNNTIHYLLDEQKIPADQIIMGFPAYGRGWTIDAKQDPKKIPSPSIGPSPPGPFTNASGHLAYFEICQMLEKDGFVSDWHELAQAPFAYKNGTNETVWISYDDQKSWHAGLDYVEAKDLGGIFVWTLDQDDFDGRCTASNGKFPLTKVASDRLGKGVDERLAVRAKKA